MISAARLCALCADSYVQPPSWKDPASDIRAIVAEIEGVLVIAIPGTKAPEDFLRDAEDWPVEDPDTGTNPAGFHREAMVLLGLIAPSLVARRFALTGHSLGGAVALILGGKLAARGLVPEAVVTFGAPRTGFAKLRKAYAGVSLPLYRHGNDPIPEAPPIYQHPAELISIGRPMADPLSCHFLAGYQAALVAMPAAA